jgi:hypothetical protein
VSRTTQSFCRAHFKSSQTGASGFRQATFAGTQNRCAYSRLTCHGRGSCTQHWHNPTGSHRACLYGLRCKSLKQNGAGAGTRTRMSVGSGDFKSFADGGLKRDYRHTSCKRRNLDGVFPEPVLTLFDDSSDTVVTQWPLRPPPSSTSTSVRGDSQSEYYRWTETAIARPGLRQ